MCASSSGSTAWRGSGVGSTSQVEGITFCSARNTRSLNSRRQNSSSGFSQNNANHNFSSSAGLKGGVTAIFRSRKPSRISPAAGTFAKSKS